VKTILENPHQNKVAERMNKTILEHVRSMRIHTGLSKKFWADTTNTTVYLINRGPSVPLNCGISLNHLRIFGCISYVHVELDRRRKLNPKSKRCIFNGYRASKYNYQFWDPENRKILMHKDVVFNEGMVYKDLLTKRSIPEQQSSAADSEFVEFDDVLVEKI